jgi:hypothetical protein
MSKLTIEWYAMTNEALGKRIAELEKRLAQEQAVSEHLRTLANIHGRRMLEAERRLAETREWQPEVLEALSFAKSVIQCGEPWTDTCERVIQGAIDNALERRRTVAGEASIAEGGEG